ncbi:MAG TPA: hypothetical protein DCQ06_11810 [Myxococcales bacterium]|nr:hypothetical protein [Myxococcales bacterium]HAN32274.1 hypothetical protein [Myxococcales bacterium]
MQANFVSKTLLWSVTIFVLTQVGCATSQTSVLRPQTQAPATTEPVSVSSSTNKNPADQSGDNAKMQPIVPLSTSATPIVKPASKAQRKSSKPTDSAEAIPALGVEAFDDILWLIGQRHIKGRIPKSSWLRAINGALSVMTPPRRLTQRSILLKERLWHLRMEPLGCATKRWMLRKRVAAPKDITADARRQWREQKGQRRQRELRILRRAGANKAELLCAIEHVKTHLRATYSEPAEQSSRLTQMWGRAISALLREVDPHARIIPSATFERLDRETGGTKSVDIGVVVQPSRGHHRVIYLQRSSPARQAGLRLGDRLVEINGQAISTWSSNQVDAALRGAPGSSLSLTVGSLKPRHLIVKRQQVRRSSVTARHHGPSEDLWVIRLKAFASGMAADFKEVLKQLGCALGHGPKAIIIDLRGNTGGHVSEAVAIADHFISKGEIVRLKLRFKKDEVHRATRANTDVSSRLVLLVDGRCRSACELLADALQATGRAVVVGDVTYGKGSAQRLYSTQDLAPWDLIITIGLFHGPDGSSVQLRGVRPDLSLDEISAPSRRERDHANAIAERRRTRIRRRVVSARKRRTLKRCVSKLKTTQSKYLQMSDRALGRTLALTTQCLVP